MFSSSPKSSKTEFAAVPGLSEVTAACDMLTHSETSSAVLSIHHTGSDSTLIALSREIAEQSGVDMNVESSDSALVLRFSRPKGKANR